MITRATILTGDADSPVVLHVPDCPTTLPTEITPRMLLDGSLDTTADRIVRHARSQSRRRPHAVLNRLPQYLDDAVPEEVPRRGGRTQLCSHHHAGVATASEPYLALLRSIVEERIAAVGHAFVIQVRTTVADDAVGPMRIRIGVDPEFTPRSIADAAMSAFAGFDVIVSDDSAVTWTDPPTAAAQTATVQVLAIDVHTRTISTRSQSATGQLGDALALLVNGIDDDDRHSIGGMPGPRVLLRRGSSAES